MKIILAFPPSSNRYWRVANNRIYRSTAATLYKNEVEQLCNTAGVEPLTGNISITLAFYRPAKRGDLDNRIKIVLDAMQGFAYLNDSQIVEIHATRHEDRACPRVEVIVKEVPPER